MFELDLLLKLRINIAEELNVRLEEGDSLAFKGLETYIQVAVNDSASKVFRSEKDLGRVTRIKIEDAGPYNVIWEECADNEHDWQEQSGEPAKDVCSKCGKERW